MPGVPSQGGGSSWPRGRCPGGLWQDVDQSLRELLVFCLTEVYTRLLFLKLFLIQSRGLWVEGGTGGQLWERPGPEQGSEPGVTQEALLGPEQP